MLDALGKEEYQFHQQIFGWVVAHFNLQYEQKNLRLNTLNLEDYIKFST